MSDNHIGWTGKKCTKCGGTGESDEDGRAFCPACAGTGEEYCSEPKVLPTAMSDTPKILPADKAALFSREALKAAGFLDPVDVAWNGPRPWTSEIADNVKKMAALDRWRVEGVALPPESHKPTLYIDLLGTRIAISSDGGLDLHGTKPDDAARVFWAAVEQLFQNDLTAARARIAELEAQHLATQLALWSPEHVFAVCRMLRDAACSGVSRDQFYAGLSIGLGGCDRDYADNVFCNFQDNPAAFLASRVPNTQSIELLKIILERHAVAKADGKEARS